MLDFKQKFKLVTLFSLILLMLFFIAPNLTHAQTNTNQPDCTGNSPTDTITKVCTDFGAFSNIGDYIAAIVSTWVIPLGVTGAILMITFAGFQYIYSGGSPETIKLAKELIVGAILGLILIFMASYILNAIVPSDELNVDLSAMGNRVELVG